MGQLTCSPECVARAQQGVAAALRHYTTAPVARPYYVRGVIPQPGEAAVIVALWTGPSARVKQNLYLLIPLISHDLPVPAVRVAMGLIRLRRGVHLFGFTGRHFDGKRVLNGSDLVEGQEAACLCGQVRAAEGPQGFYFERPGKMRTYQ